jgi:hypothetical protein
VLSVADEQWSEAEHQLSKRLPLMVAQGSLTPAQAQVLRDAVDGLLDERVIEVIPRTLYEHKEAIARRRVPRDPNDWPPVALALC